MHKVDSTLLDYWFLPHNFTNGVMKVAPKKADKRHLRD